MSRSFIKGEEKIRPVRHDSFRVAIAGLAQPSRRFYRQRLADGGLDLCDGLVRAGGDPGGEAAH